MKGMELIIYSVSYSVVPNPLGPLWTAAHQAPLSMGFSRQEYWSGFPFLSPGDLPDRGIEHRSPALQADSLPSELQGSPNVFLNWQRITYSHHASLASDMLAYIF